MVPGPDYNISKESLSEEERFALMYQVSEREDHDRSPYHPAAWANSSDLSMDCMSMSEHDTESAPRSSDLAMFAVEEHGS